jgi:glycosyltransferase involved in cell wall biosynthesis
VDILLRAARLQPKLEVRIVGDGPDQDELEKEFAAVAGVRFLGRLHGRELDEAYAKARAVVLPSLWYENHPLIVLEAYAHGKPVIASRLGALQEVVRDNETGLLFRPGDERELVSALERLIRDPDLGSRLGREGRQWLEKDNSPDLHYRRIMSAYDEASRAARPEKLHSD